MGERRLSQRDQEKLNNALRTGACDFGKAGIYSLIDQGADPDGKDQPNDRPLITAAASGNLEAGAALIDAGANPDAATSHGLTPLMAALRNYKEKTARMLMEAGADTKAKDVDGMTALHWAAKVGNEKIVRDLLKSGADPNARTSIGKTALIHAAEFGIDPVIRELLDAGADIEAAATWERRTALHEASERGFLGCVSLLLERGADFGKKDALGKTAEDVARENRRDDCEKVLAARRASQEEKEILEGSAEMGMKQRGRTPL